MKRRFPLERGHRGLIGFFSFIVILILLSTLIPPVLWLLEGEHQGSVLLFGGSGENTPGLWPFLNRKYTSVQITDSPEDLISVEGDGRVFLISGHSHSPSDEDQARLTADIIRDKSLNYTLTLVEASAFGEMEHPLQRSILADFLGFYETGWAALYVRDKRTIKRMEPVMKERILAVPAHIREKPFLYLSHSSGEWAVLEADRDFSGRVPMAEMEGKQSEVYGWIPLYKLKAGTESCGMIDFHLTEVGRSHLASLGISETFPLLLKKKSMAGERWFFTLPVRNSLSDPGSPKRSLKEWYFRNMALFRPGSEDKLFWKIYMEVLTAAMDPNHSALHPPLTVDRDFQFRADTSGFSREGKKGREQFFIKGVNLGSALPGFWSTEFPEDEELYLRWFASMKEMNLNTVRIYTLFPPAFYRSLALFNSAREEDPLFLIQEIWPEENPPDRNLLDQNYVSAFRNEIAHNIDALHGRGEISPRKGRAWGVYTRDVSAWVSALLIGRELEPDEVRETDRINGNQNYSGRFISAKGSASEAWLASMCDYAAVYEFDTYGTFRPVGLVSWPTLDPLDHPSEWTDPELMGRAPYNDSEQIDINNFSVSADFSPGLFGAYHIYPNYPDFMNNEESYTFYSDDEGVFRYGAYLKEFMDQHRKYPALVAEYGLSTSLVTAHFNPDGYNHGGMTEEQQGRGIIRMTEAIKKEGYSGVLIFEWADEWAKKTWTTEPFMIPYDRQANWHNILDPEQNYGIVAMRSAGSKGEIQYIRDEINLAVSSDESYLKIDINYHEGSRLLLGFDTYSKERGAVRFPGDLMARTPGGMEFLAELDLKGKGAGQFFAQKSYNLGLNSYSSIIMAEPDFQPVSLLVNRSYRDSGGVLQKPLYADWSTLPPGDLSEGSHSLSYRDKGLTLRIPWGLLNVSDPSSSRVIDDESIRYAYPLRDALQTVETAGIGIYGVLFDGEGEVLSLFPSDDGKSFTDKLFYTWQNWNVPRYRESPKKSFEILKEYFSD